MSLPILEILDSYLREKQKVYFVQVGANDGVTGDRLHQWIAKDSWQGILVEPVPYLFERLKNTYKDSKNKLFENVAIATEEGEKELFLLRENNDGLPVWYDQLGSFDKDVVLSHREYIPNIDQYLISETVSCVTLETLLERHGCNQLDLLYVDTEGYDFEVIKSMNFNKLKPRLVLYEHKHLGKDVRKEAESFLSKLGYRCVSERDDTLAYLTVAAV